MKITLLGAIGVDDIGDVIMLKKAVCDMSKIAVDLGEEIIINIVEIKEGVARKQLESFDEKYEYFNSLEESVLDKFEYDLTFEKLLKDNDLELKIPIRFIDMIKESQGIFFIGGGYFNTYWGKKMWSKFVIPLALCNKFNKKVFISGISFGPFSKKERQSLKGIFDICTKVILRDRVDSHECIKDLGVDESKLVLGSDDILPCWDRWDYYDENEIVKEHKNYAVVQLHHWTEKFCSNPEHFYSELAKVFDSLIERNILDKVIFIPFDYFKGVDYDYGIRVFEKVKQKDRFLVLEPLENDIQIRYLVKHSKFVIASRYHPIVFSLGETIPALGIYVNDLYKQKIKGVYETLGIEAEKHIMYIDDFSFEAFYEWFKNIDQNEFKTKKDTILNYKRNRIKEIKKFFEDIKSVQL